MMPDEVGYAFWPGIMRLDIAGCGWMTVAVGGQLGSHLGFARNQLWCEIIALACELLAWTQLLTLAGEARRWEPKRLRLRSVISRISPDASSLLTAAAARGQVR